MNWTMCRGFTFRSFVILKMDTTIWLALARHMVILSGREMELLAIGTSGVLILGHHCWRGSVRVLISIWSGTGMRRCVEALLGSEIF